MIFQNCLKFHEPLCITIFKYRYYSWYVFMSNIVTNHATWHFTVAMATVPTVTTWRPGLNCYRLWVQFASHDINSKSNNIPVKLENNFTCILSKIKIFPYLNTQEDIRFWTKIVWNYHLISVIAIWLPIEIINMQK